MIARAVESVGRDHRLDACADRAVARIPCLPTRQAPLRLVSSPEWATRVVECVVMKPTREDTSHDEEAEQLRRLRWIQFRQGWGFCCALGVSLVLMVGCALFHSEPPWLYPVTAVFVVAGLVVTDIDLRSRCPRCGQMLFIGGKRRFRDRHRCWSCGLGKKKGPDEP